MINQLLYSIHNTLNNITTQITKQNDNPQIFS